MRFVKLALSGPKKAYIYQISDDYLRVDIPDVKASGYVYLYFPRLIYGKLLIERPYESHPFSVLCNDAPHPASHSQTSEKGETPMETDALFKYTDEKPRSQDCQLHSYQSSKGGITLMMRIRDGLSRELEKHAVPLRLGASPQPITVLVEKSYSAHGMGSLFSTKDCDLGKFSKVLVIAGGVGITAVLPLLREAAAKSDNVHLQWGVRHRTLVNAVEDIMAGTQGTPAKPWGNITAKISVGERMFVKEIMEKELQDSTTLVIVSGPSSLAHEARKYATQQGAKGAVVRYVSTLR